MYADVMKRVDKMRNEFEELNQLLPTQSARNQSGMYRSPETKAMLRVWYTAYSFYTNVSNAAQALQMKCHGAARDAGWWGDAQGNSVTANPLCFSNKLCLIHSEISEAMEGDRKGLMDDKLPHREMREVELADAVIRIFDLAGAYGMDLGGAIAEKLVYNAQRADHKPEARAAAGGKSY